ncbi:phage/plasmid primase, P4 family, partial [Heyndrickxia sporothermodurans]
MSSPLEDILNLSDSQQRKGQRSGSNAELLTEDWAARAFAERHAGQLLFCHDSGKWHVWTGAAWVPNRCDVVLQWARELAREMRAGESTKVQAIAAKVSFAAGVERFARSDPVFAVTIDGWDPDPWLLGTPDGTVDLRRGEMRSASREDRITKLTAVSPATAPDCPTWLHFLADATGSDAALIRFLQQWCGYSLTGLTREHALVFVYGPGGNGKSVFLNVITAILGAYATTAAMDTFTASKGDKHPTDLAM